MEILKETFIYSKDINKSNKMKKNRWFIPIILGLILCMTFIISSENTSAYLTSVTTPVSDSWVNGTWRFLVANSDTSSGNSGILNITNVTIYYRTGTSGAWTYLNNSVNTTVGDPNFNMTFVTTSLTDGTTYQFNFTAYNGSGAISWNYNSSLIVTGIKVDNTNPTASFVLTKSSLELSDPRGVGLDCSASSDTVDDQLTIIYYITDPLGTTTTTKTVNNDSGQDLVKWFDDDRSVYDTLGTYTATCRVYDDISGRLGVEATNKTFQVTSEDTILEDAVTAEQKQTKTEQTAINNTVIIIVIVFIVMIFTITLLWILLKKKK